VPRFVSATLVPDTVAAERARCAGLIRDSIGVLASKWAVDVLLVLGHGSRRYHELLAELEPISEKVLTQTLRGMERDGLIERQAADTRTRYALTPLGAKLAPPLKALASWSLEHGEQVEAAREDFDSRLVVRAAS